MTTAVLSNSRIAKNARTKARARAKFFEMPQINWSKLCVFGIILATGLLLFYVYQINVLTKKTYLVAKHEAAIDEISQANRRLQIEFAENSLLGQVPQKALLLSLQKSTDVKYIQVSDSSLADAK